jgi:hypothetical protein
VTATKYDRGGAVGYWMSQPSLLRVSRFILELDPAPEAADTDMPGADAAVTHEADITDASEAYDAERSLSACSAARSRDKVRGD